MHDRAKKWQPTLAGTGLLLLLLGSGCSDSNSGDDDVGRIKEAKSALQRAQDCADLLSMLKADAVAKLKMEATRLIAQYQPENYGSGVIGMGRDPVASDGDFSGGESPTAPPSSGPSPTPGAPQTDSAAGGNGSNTGSGGTASGDNNESAGEGSGPTGSSNTNTQVEGVDEADFVKVVRMGESMFVLHGNGLYKLDTWPADLTSLKSDIVIEGSPSEMFVTDAGKAVVFSSVEGYGANPPVFTNGGREDVNIAKPCAAIDSAFGGVSGCGGGYYGAPATKITVVDVSGDSFETEREFYFQGSYTSSRRYADIVRVVFQSGQTIGYAGLGHVNSWKESSDPNAAGRSLTLTEYRQAVNKKVAEQTAAVEKTKLEDWLPVLYEAKKGKLAKVEPACDDFFVPPSGLTGEGLTHVLTLDLEKGGVPGGVTIMGAAQTVYSNLDHLVLAQPDYRWDFGFVGEQRTNLHVFGINKADTDYEASGTVSGNLPPHNAQFGLDMRGEILRVATTGRVRANPDSEMEDADFWQTTTDNRVFTLKQKKRELEVVGKTEYLGKVNETVQSARFVGDRGYIVTFEQIDPLIVLDLKDPSEIKTLGEIEIPGFSQYMHPLDDTHLITLGTNAGWGVQLQLFDVSTFPLAKPKVFDFGEANSEGQYNHKAFTFYRELGVLALPLSRYGQGFSSTLQLIKVDAETGFDALGEVDHSSLYASQSGGCVQCESGSCYYSCYSYSPEVRRGHFVSHDDDTYVYSFSYAGVIVTDLADLSTNVASVVLPAPEWSYDSWYGEQIERPSTQGNPGTGSGSVNPSGPDAPPTPRPVDGGTAPGVGSDSAATDAGVAEQDAGSAIGG